MDHIENFTVYNFTRKFSLQITNRGSHMADILCVKFWIFI
jgi:hypothetical protein